MWLQLLHLTISSDLKRWLLATGELLLIKGVKRVGNVQMLKPI